MVKHNVLKGFYELERTIGCGGFAKVKLATHLATGEKVAIKIMEKALLKDDLPRVKLELKALKTLSHQNICKLYQVIETETHFYIVVEHCSGGELFDHIVEKNRLSETESRLFFRQIVSAVAYLHSLGYAHRDLKPENVLLDHAQNLKLIDFGLCAKPNGGMDSPLFTSCGSPTYAAPELVLGKQYLGPEVDVWAMGVLLYALLAGYLPFDDQNIDNLYKKILSGKYEEPPFISSASKRLVRQMLQVDPAKRITVGQLLSHPWLTLGVLKPVKYQEENTRCKDDDVVALMAQYHGTKSEEMWRHIQRWKYDYDTATYMLLFGRKNRGLPVKLMNGATKLPIRVRSAETISLQNVIRPNTRSNSSTLKPLNQINNIVMSDTITPKHAKVRAERKTPSTPVPAVVKTEHTTTTPKQAIGRYHHRHDENRIGTPRPVDALTPDNFVEPRRPSSIRKPQKRIRSPNLDGDCSPVPTKKTPGNVTPRTPDTRRTPMSGEGPSRSARKVLGSIERSLHKVRHVLTPRRHQGHTSSPAILTNKDLCNVSTTQCSDPEYVITELSKALIRKGIHCERKGFTIRGKMEPNVSQRLGGCSFELDICYLPAMGPQLKSTQNNFTPTKSIPVQSNTGTPLSSLSYKNGNKTYTKGIGNDFAVRQLSVANKVAIRRKRLKGDSWCYKKVCEQVLALTNTELKQKESDV